MPDADIMQGEEAACFTKRKVAASFSESSHFSGNIG